ncbi:aldehyde dehydrogenase family protein [Chitinophaga varians]|uniref:Aldehyde dehydrogenase family protein n=1 Tax=Chitinophaga varians TaxID=2202339 RepID=A0A847RZD3_9BACT|nr:aldehyde dehydrogenase family protein [Chitinophaga varians]NLR68493.1 aldehyde dehydrogenase family protein [Chitinophaga varians]
MDFYKRRNALLRMQEMLEDQALQRGLVAAYMRDTGYTYRNIRDREITIPLNMLKYWESAAVESLLFQADPVEADGNKIAIVLPSNGINILIVKTVASAFMSGREVVLKLPRKLQHAMPYYQKIVKECMPGVEMISQNLSAEDFLGRCIRSEDIRTVIVYGDDKWIWSYRNNFRRYRKELFFEGPGKDPQVVFRDADVALAARDAVRGGLVNGGHSCSALERFYVHQDVHDEFVALLVKELSGIVIGAPEETATDLSPILSPAVLRRLRHQIQNATEQGAKLIVGGNTVEVGAGGNLALVPALLVNCHNQMDAVQQESFGPIFPVIPFVEEDALITMADQSDYGLNASIYGTCSRKTYDYFYSTHRNLFVNATISSPSSAANRMVDGGFKNSGFVWEWKNDKFLQREGRRILLNELLNIDYDSAHK